MGDNIPNVTFKIRARGESVGGKNPFRWHDVSTADIFPDKNIIVFALPTLFTSSDSSTHLPGYESKYDELKSLGIDEVYCLSVKSSFALLQSAKNLGINKVKMLPDAHAEFTRSMGMLVQNENFGAGDMSWRYSAYVVNGEIKKIFTEAGMTDNSPDDPFECSDVDTMISYLKK
jgi:thioredoxin-dependent peroxiredoxin